MVNKFIACILSALIVLPALAQETAGEVEETVEYSDSGREVVLKGPKANWFISAGFGGQVYFGDHDNRVPFFQRVAPALDIAVGKWFTPTLGFRFMYSGLSYKGATQDGTHTLGVPVPGKGGAPYWLEKQKFNSVTLATDLLVNLSTVILGYREKMIWNCSPYIGVGLARVTQTPKNNEFLVRGGLFNAFRVAEGWDVNLDVKMSYVNDEFDGEFGGRSGEGILSATVGVSYKCKPRGFGRQANVTRYVRGNSDDLIRQINELKAENDALASEAEKLKGVEVGTNEVIVNKFVTAYEIFFKDGSETLGKEYQVNLSLFSEIIAKSGSKVVLVGMYPANADSAARKTVEHRAEMVKDCLVKEFNVPEENVKIEFEYWNADSKFKAGSVVVKGE